MGDQLARVVGLGSFGSLRAGRTFQENYCFPLKIKCSKFERRIMFILKHNKFNMYFANPSLPKHKFENSSQSASLGYSHFVIFDFITSSFILVLLSSSTTKEIDIFKSFLYYFIGLLLILPF